MKPTKTQPTSFSAIQIQRRDIALALCKELDDLLDFGEENRGPILSHAMDLCFHPNIKKLRQTYDPPNLPAGGQQLWHILESLIDKDLRPQNAPKVTWKAFALGIANFKTWLLDQYGLNANSFSDPGEWDSRIQCNRTTLTVSLDGHDYDVERPEQFWLIKVLLDAAKSSRGVMGQKELRSQVVGENEGSEKTVPGLIRTLPDPLKAIIRTKPGAGTWLCLKSLPRRR